MKWPRWYAVRRAWRWRGRVADGRRARDWAETNRAAREFTALFFGGKL